MERDITQELFQKQGKVISTLLLRISVLEQLLLEKGVVTEQELVDKCGKISQEFIEKIQEVTAAKLQSASHAQEALKNSGIKNN